MPTNREVVDKLCVEYQDKSYDELVAEHEIVMTKGCELRAVLNDRLEKAAEAFAERTKDRPLETEEDMITYCEYANGYHGAIIASVNALSRANASDESREAINKRIERYQQSNKVFVEAYKRYKHHPKKPCFETRRRSYATNAAKSYFVASLNDEIADE